jgi:hypothetical protein
MIYKFGENDIFYNRIETHPKFNFFIHKGKVYYNNKAAISGAFTSTVGCVPTGFVNLYEENVDRNAAQTGLIYPFITKESGLSSFKTVSTSQFNSDFSYGDTITSSYPLSASLSREFYTIGEDRPHITALKTSFDYYQSWSRHYAYSSSFGNKSTQKINLINIPSILFGSYIEKGTLDLKMFYSGTLIAELKDTKKNGELIQVGPSGSTGSGSIAGVVLYNEGFISLTGSWTIKNDLVDYTDDPTDPQYTSWLYFGWGLNDGLNQPAISTSGSLYSYTIDYKGTTKVPVMTMLAHAPRGELNHSNNPTFIDKSSTNLNVYYSSSYSFGEATTKIKNTTSASYSDPEPPFKKTTYITKIGIYDENKNLIAIANIAEPVKKTEDRDFTFKLKLDF